VFVATGRFSSSLNMVVFEREKIRKLPLQKTCEITVICILSAIITIYTIALTFAVSNLLGI
jgi:hypothetical protein